MLNSQPIEEEKHENDHSHNSNNEDNVYNRFSKHVIERRIERDDFCRACNIFVTMEELADCFKNTGFPISKDELLLVFTEHNAHKSGYLPMEDFYAKLRCWSGFKQKRDLQMQEIMEEANKVVDQNMRGTHSKKRPITAVVAGAKNLRTMTSQQS